MKAGDRVRRKDSDQVGTVKAVRSEDAEMPDGRMVTHNYAVVRWDGLSYDAGVALVALEPLEEKTAS